MVKLSIMTLVHKRYYTLSLVLLVLLITLIEIKHFRKRRNNSLTTARWKRLPNDALEEAQNKKMISKLQLYNRLIENGKETPPNLKFKANGIADRKLQMVTVGDLENIADTKHKLIGPTDRSWTLVQEPVTSTLANIEVTSTTKQPQEAVGCVMKIQILGKLKLKQTSGEYFCPEQNCTIRYLQSLEVSTIPKMDATILHHKRALWKWQELVRLRLPAPIWIYLTQEPPVKSYNAYNHGKKLLRYNLTMTYRTDSDIYFPYGRYVPNKPEVPNYLEINWAANKTKLIVWMSSNCDNTFWKRREFVSALNDVIHVDMYGKCGDLRCSKGSDCEKVLWNYKFYLALENSECDDYITEKFWEKALSYQAIPIVYGPTRENYEQIAPPHSFIHLNEFDDMAALVEYIKYLDGNDTAYNEYFEWRKYGTTVVYRERDLTEYKWLMCDILRNVVKLSEAESTDSEFQPMFINMTNWWKPTCHKSKGPFKRN